MCNRYLGAEKLCVSYPAGYRFDSSAAQIFDAVLEIAKSRLIPDMLGADGLSPDGGLLTPCPKNSAVTARLGYNELLGRY